MPAYPRGFSTTPDDDAHAWDDMVQRNASLQAANDPLFDPARNTFATPDPQAPQ